MVKILRRRSRQAGYLVVALLVAGYGYWALTKPQPRLQPQKAVTDLQVQSAPSKLAWPGVGQSAVGIVGTSILEMHGSQTPAPTASTAKIITVLNVLRIKPLQPGQPGPTITLTANDAAIYNAYVAEGGSVVPVQAGEQISEYQMLQAILLPSANNMADSLAIWAFGSLPAYATTATSYLHQLGLTETHIGVDASGFSPTTTSTAHDLAQLGELAMQNPVLASIVNQSSASGIPLTNGVKNVNFLLGTNNIIGVKTGNTDQAGGVYVSASRAVVNGKPVTIVTALVGAPTLFESMKDSIPLIGSAQANFATTSVITAGAVVGRYHMPWGGSVGAIVSKDLNVTTWNGSTVSTSINLQPVSAKARADKTVGTVSSSGSPFTSEQPIPVKLQNAPTAPSILWRLTHPL
jgi:D-alanyl-D-alanine carboxypeptidase (penicillin-binding protein 5/6)